MTRNGNPDGKPYAWPFIEIIMKNITYKTARIRAPYNTLYPTNLSKKINKFFEIRE